MKQIPDHVFRGYDLRGIVGTDLDEENVLILAKGYATYLLQRRIYDEVIFKMDSLKRAGHRRDFYER